VLGVREDGELAPDIENGHAWHAIVLYLFRKVFTRDKRMGAMSRVKESVERRTLCGVRLSLMD